jgi:hypothetical protein
MAIYSLTDVGFTPNHHFKHLVLMLEKARPFLATVAYSNYRLTIESESSTLQQSFNIFYTQVDSKTNTRFFLLTPFLGFDINTQQNGICYHLFVCRFFCAAHESVIFRGLGHQSPNWTHGLWMKL